MRPKHAPTLPKSRAERLVVVHERGHRIEDGEGAPEQPHQAQGIFDACEKRREQGSCHRSGGQKHHERDGDQEFQQHIKREETPEVCSHLLDHVEGSHTLSVLLRAVEQRALRDHSRKKKGEHEQGEDGELNHYRAWCADGDLGGPLPDGLQEREQTV